MAIPPAGGDGLWLRENLGEFRQRAEEGDERFRELMREVGERGGFGVGDAEQVGV